MTDCCGTVHFCWRVQYLLFTAIASADNAWRWRLRCCSQGDILQTSKNRSLFRRLSTGRFRCLFWQIIISTMEVINGFYIQSAWTVDWMNTGWARAVVITVYIWKNLGYNIILFLAGLQNIPGEYYESAQVDGPSAFRRFTSITLVYLAPTSFFVFVISIINSFKVFRETYLVAGSYPQQGIYMLQHYMNNMFSSLDYQKLTAGAFIMASIITLLVLLMFGPKHHKALE